MFCSTDAYRYFRASILSKFYLPWNSIPSLMGLKMKAYCLLWMLYPRTYIVYIYTQMHVDNVYVHVCVRDIYFAQTMIVECWELIVPLSDLFSVRSSWRCLSHAWWNEAEPWFVLLLYWFHYLVVSIFVTMLFFMGVDKSIHPVFYSYRREIGITMRAFCMSSDDTLEVIKNGRKRIYNWVLDIACLAGFMLLPCYVNISLKLVIHFVWHCS